MIAEYLLFIEEIKETKLSQETLGFIGSGNVYVFGKDKDECTNIYMCMTPKIRSVEMKEYLDLIRFLLLLVRNQTCIPGYLERMNLVINLVGSESSKAFMVHFLDRLRYLAVRTFPFHFNRVIFYGSLGDIKDKVEEFQKKLKSYCEVTIIEEGSSDILNIIEAEQLERKFGGSRINCEEYWPPTHHTTPGEAMDNEDCGRMRTIPFFIYDEDYTSFVQEHIPQDLVISKRGFVGQGGMVKGKLGMGDKIASGPNSETLTKGGEEGRVQLRRSRDRQQAASQDRRPTDKQSRYFKDETDTVDGNNTMIGGFKDTDMMSYAGSFHPGHISKHRLGKKPKPEAAGGFFKFLGCCGDR